MDQVFAPWRIEWIERDEREADGCVFCELPDREEDRESRLVARSERAYVLLNNYPYNPGHVMVIPRRHPGDYAALSDADLLEVSRLTQRTIRALREAFDPAGFNAGYNLGRGAGGSIDDHLHMHVVPRWEGDTNYMAVIAETKVIVEALEDSYDRLHEAFAGQERTAVEDADRAVRVEFETPEL